MKYFYLSIWLILMTPALAQDKPPNTSWTFTVRFENDLFAETDQYYTNGIKLSWISPDLTRFRDSKQLPDWGKKIIRHLPYSQVEGLQRNIAFSIGQKMFTPVDIQRRDLINDDRPYGGWLYGAAAFHNKDYRHLDTFEIQAGIIGPLSFAEEVQDLVHELRGIDKTNGWDNQLKNEPGLALFYEHKDRLVTPKTFAGFGFDAIIHYGGVMGNVFTYANAGIEMRAGWNLPTDFGSSLIRPGGDTNAPADTMDPRYLEDSHGFGLHLIAAATGRLVIRDIFLDGNTFRDSHSVDREWWVGDFILGISLILDSFKLSYLHVFRTPEFEEQKSGHNFGSISLSYTY